MPKCTINGKEIEVKEGTSIIEAMKQLDQPIAHYCWHPGLSVAGVCRLCMVEIEGNPRVQIACNTQVTEGMKINNTSDKVKEAVKWGLDFHLINHPLDCPICDQAGECGLQEQYMTYGQYDSEMAEPKVKKRKVVDLGPRVVLDSERCILCSRCVRFTDEVSKTHELGIFNRGDHSEIGTFDDRPLNNEYSVNVVDICPVGALTSKDFRFKQRVWYLKEADSICTGCSTGCNTKVYFNKEGVFRIKPRFNAEINSYWMCDQGRDTYKFLNLEYRLQKGLKKTGSGDAPLVSDFAGATLKDAVKSFDDSNLTKTALVVSAQLSQEDLKSLTDFAKSKLNKNIFVYTDPKHETGEFDGLLIRADKNPNSLGLKQIFESQGLPVNSAKNLPQQLKANGIENIILVAPENLGVYSDFAAWVGELSKGLRRLLIFASSKLDFLEKLGVQELWAVPIKTYFEKDGTYVNAQGKSQFVKKAGIIVSEALTVSQAAEMLQGGSVAVPAALTQPAVLDFNKRPDSVTQETRKKNEFVFRRGSL